MPPRGRRRTAVAGAPDATAAAAASSEAASQAESGEPAQVNPASVVLERIPIAQRVLKYASTSLHRLAQLAGVCDAWNETVMDFGAVITEAAIHGKHGVAFAGIRDDDDFDDEDAKKQRKRGARARLLLTLFDLIARAPSFPVFFCHVVDVYCSRHCPASLSKRLPLPGKPTILHALCYRHRDLTDQQQQNRLMCLRYLLSKAPGIDINAVTGEICAAHVPRGAAARAIVQAKRLVCAAPWSINTKQSPLSIAIDGLASAEFLTLLVSHPKARHAPRSTPTSHSLSSLQLAANASNTTAMKVLVDTGVAAKLVKLQHERPSNKFSVPGGATTTAAAAATAASRSSPSAAASRITWNVSCAQVSSSSALVLAAARFHTGFPLTCISRRWNPMGGGFVPVLDPAPFVDWQLDCANPVQTQATLFALLDLLPVYLAHCPNVVGDALAVIFCELPETVEDLCAVPIAEVLNGISIPSAPNAMRPPWMARRPYVCAHHLKMEVMDRFYEAVGRRPGELLRILSAAGRTSTSSTALVRALDEHAEWRKTWRKADAAN